MSIIKNLVKCENLYSINKDGKISAELANKSNTFVCCTCGEKVLLRRGKKK